VAQIEDWLAENYAQVRLDRGWTWEQLAEDFDRQGAPELAAWARASDDTPKKRAPKKVERATVKAPETRGK
jgi:hypothetical protein